MTLDYRKCDMQVIIGWACVLVSRDNDGTWQASIYDANDVKLRALIWETHRRQFRHEAFAAAIDALERGEVVIER